MPAPLSSVLCEQFYSRSEHFPVHILTIWLLVRVMAESSVACSSVLLIMRPAAGITLNLAKCEFAKSQVKFVGRIVGSGTHHPDPERVEELVRVEPPSSKKQLRQILGAISESMWLDTPRLQNRLRI